MSETQTTTATTQPRIMNCHVHTFTHVHTPKHFLPWPVPELARLRWFRWLLYQVARITSTTNLAETLSPPEPTYVSTRNELQAEVGRWFDEHHRGS
jgi:hypothetical protein